MSNINLTVRPAMPSADWTSQNPPLAQFEIGFESDTGKAKVNLSPTPTAYNSLSYFSPFGGIGLLSSTTVHTNVGTKQALYTVPAGKYCIPTMIVVRNPSTSLAAMADEIGFGFDADPSDLLYDTSGVQFTTLVAADDVRMFSPVSDIAQLNAGAPGPMPASKVGSAGAILGCRFHDTSIDATVVIDVFGYLY